MRIFRSMPPLALLTLFFLVGVIGGFSLGEARARWLSPSPPTPMPVPTKTSLPPSPTVTTAPSPAPTSTPSSTPTPTIIPTPTATPWPDGAAETIGTSVEGRPLEVYRFGHGPNQRMIVAGIHGGYEWNTVDLAKRMIATLKTNPAWVPEDTTLFILPVLNPDGYEDHRGTAYGRANANQVDINRNFDAFWASDWDRTHCWHALYITAGPKPFSEPESQALRDFLNRPDIHIQALLSYHSAGSLVFPGGQPPHPASLDLATHIANVTGFRLVVSDPNDLCEYTGQLIDWAAQQDIAAIDVELPDHYHLDWERQWRTLKAFLQWQPPQPTTTPAPATETPHP